MILVLSVALPLSIFDLWTLSSARVLIWNGFVLSHKDGILNVVMNEPLWFYLLFCCGVFLCASVHVHVHTVRRGLICACICAYAHVIL